MTNYHVFDTVVNPVYTKMTNTYQAPGIIAPPENNAVTAGNQYSITGSASALVVLSLISAVISLRLNNPAGSGKTIYISRITGCVGGSSLLSSLSGSALVNKGGTLTAPASLTPANNNFSSTNTSVMTAQSSTAVISGGTTLLSFQLAPGPFSQDYKGSIINPAGQRVCVQCYIIQLYDRINDYFCRQYQLVGSIIKNNEIRKTVWRFAESNK